MERLHLDRRALGVASCGIVALDVPGLNLMYHVEVRRSPHLHDLEQVAETLSLRFSALLTDTRIR